MANQTRLLELALKGLELERERIDGEIADIRSQLNGAAAPKTSAPVRTATGHRRNRLSAAGRKAIVEALKRRWAAKRRLEARKK
jgi:hypothetical protein